MNWYMCLIREHLPFFFTLIDTWPRKRERLPNVAKKSMVCSCVLCSPCIIITIGVARFTENCPLNSPIVTNLWVTGPLNCSSKKYSLFVSFNHVCVFGFSSGEPFLVLRNSCLQNRTVSLFMVSRINRNLCPPEVSNSLF